MQLVAGADAPPVEHVDPGVNLLLGELVPWFASVAVGSRSAGDPPLTLHDLKKAFRGFCDRVRGEGHTHADRIASPQFQHYLATHFLESTQGEGSTAAGGRRRRGHRHRARTRGHVGTEPSTTMHTRACSRCAA